MRRPGPRLVTMSIDERDDSDVDAWMGLLDEDAAARAQRFRRAPDRVRHVAAHALLRAVLAAETGRAPADVVLRRDGRSKLHLVDGAGLDFSLTHTQGLVAVAVHGSPVGCDAEPVDRHVDPAAIRMLAPAERTWLDGVAAHERDRRFLELWVAKEAFSKAVGLGLALSLASYAIDVSGVPKLLSAPAECGPCEEWRFIRPDVAASHVLALAMRDAPSKEPVETIAVTPDRLTLLARHVAGAIIGGMDALLDR